MRQPSDQDKAFTWYFAALKYGAGSPQAPIHADEPQCGYFRIKLNGQVLPAYIALESPVDENGELDGDERLICKISNVERDPHQAWTWLAGHPVAYDYFKAAWETGKWPDEAPGANFQFSDSLDGLTDLLEAMMINASKLGPIDSQVKCDQAANLKDRVQACHKAMEAMRRAEKAPLDKAAQAVQNKFLPHLAKAMNLIDELRLAMEPWLTKAREAARAAAVEVAGEGAAANIEVKARAGGMEGRRTGLRDRRVPVIVNYKTAAIAVLDEPEVKAGVEKAVKRWFREGKTAPGVEVREESKVI